MSSSTKTLERWNRKLHFYIGLYLLLFLWLFAFSGLLLNHGAWRFAEFWPQRKVTTEERAVRIPTDATDLVLAKELMAQLDLRGELMWTETRPQENQFRFNLSRPGGGITVTLNRLASRASVETIRFNVWGLLRTLHTFNGVSFREPGRIRDWLPTILWVVSMDAVAIGSIFLVLSGVYMWYQLKPKRRLGLGALGVGLVVGAFFVFGLARLF